MRLIITLCSLALFSIAGAQKWHSTHKYPERGASQPTSTPGVVTERQRRELPTDGLFHDLYKRSAEKEEGNEPSELPEAGEGVEIPEDGEGETGGEVEKRQAPEQPEHTKNGEKKRLARQVQDSKEDVRPFRKRRDQVSALHGKHGRRKRQVDTSDEESKGREKREEAVEESTTSAAQTTQPAASAFDETRLRRQADCEEPTAAEEGSEADGPSPKETAQERRKREGDTKAEGASEALADSESLAKGEPEQPIESANDAESASRVRRVSRAGSSHRNRPSTVNRMSKTNGNNGDTQQQSPDDGSA